MYSRMARDTVENAAKVKNLEPHVAYCNAFFFLSSNVMAPSKTGKSAATAAKKSSAKKEKVFHPQSRKADQLSRKSLRKDKMGGLATGRNKKHNLLGELLFIMEVSHD